jgi:pyrroline-5-carboxylate reductase
MTRNESGTHMRLGFVGTGALTSAIVTGLKSVADNSISILLSPRNEEIAGRLASLFPDVTVAPDNQAVLDGSDVVMLGVRPQIAADVLPALRFRADHLVISLIATISRAEIASLTAPAGDIIKALPMPMVSQRQAPTIIYPPDAVTSEIFSRLGKVVAVEDSAEFDALSVVTTTFATYFKYLDTITGWVAAHGVTEPKARAYVTGIYKALAIAPEVDREADFMHLAQDYATRGGVNEQVLRELTEANIFDAISASLDRVHRRITGGAGN